MSPVAQVLDIIGRLIARYLERPVQGYDPFTAGSERSMHPNIEDEL
jgi:hypothetical protein